MAKIILYTPIYPPDRGGASRYFSDISEKLSSEAEIIILTKYSRDYAIDSYENGIRIFRAVPRSKHIPKPVRTLIEPLISFILCVYLIMVKDIKLIHAHSTSLGAIGVGIASKLTQIPIIYDCRDADFPKWLIHIGRTERWFSAAKKIDERLHNAGVPDTRIIRIPVINPDYVLDYRPSTPPSISEEGLKVLFVGSIRQQKGAQILFKSFTQISSKSPDIKLTYVGDGPLKSKLENKSENTGQGNQIEFAGELPHEKTLEHINKADILVLPSESEGLPRVVLEALDIGTAVICTPVGDIPDVVDHGVNGLLINRSVHDLRSAIDRLYNNKKELKSMCENAWANTGTGQWETAINDIKGTYCEVI